MSSEEDRHIFIHATIPFPDGYNGNHKRHHFDNDSDIIMFYHYGMIDIKKNRLGPSDQCYDSQRINPNSLFHAAQQAKRGDCQLPFGFGGMNCCQICKSPFYCDRDHTFSGIRKCKTCRNDCKCMCSLIHLPNQDREFNNWAFIHRK